MSFELKMRRKECYKCENLPEEEEDELRVLFLLGFPLTCLLDPPEGDVLPTEGEASAMTVSTVF